MPTNEQRRATAKRKLERQLEKAGREGTQTAPVHDHRIGGGRGRGDRGRGGDDRHHQPRSGRPDDGVGDARTASTSSEASPLDAPEPATGRRAAPFQAPEGLGGDCQYPASAEAASKPNKAPRTGKVPTEPAPGQRQHGDQSGQHRAAARQRQVAVHGQQLRSLAQQGFFDDTPCHRLTTSDSLAVLQCGDPTGEGTGGPGYQFANEYPTDQYQPDDPKLDGARDLSARHAGHGQRRSGHQRQPVLPGLQGFAAAAATTPCSARSTRPVWPRWTRSPPPGPSTAGRTARRSGRQREVDRAGLTAEPLPFRWPRLPTPPTSTPAISTA